MTATARVLVDANILYSRTLRDWLGVIYTGEDQPFQVFWTEDILAEAVYHLRRNNAQWSGATIAQFHDRISQTFEVGRVVDFDVLPTNSVSDPHDQHVHAAAIACSADVLLTCNVKDFGHPEQYDVMAPDAFFTLVDDSHPHCVRSAVEKQIEFWAKRTEDIDLPARLRRVDCPEFASRVLAHLRAIAVS